MLDQPTSSPAITLAATPVASLRGLVLGLVAALGGGIGAGIGLASLKGWQPGDGALGVAASAALGAAAVALGAIAGVALLLAPAARSARTLGLRVLAASATRMMVALFACVVLLFVANPHAYSFFAALTVSFLLFLAVETGWAAAALKRGAPAPAGSGHRPPHSAMMHHSLGAPTP